MPEPTGPTCCTACATRAQITTLTRERDEARASEAELLTALREANRNRIAMLGKVDELIRERDQLAAALDRATSVRVDTRDVIWHPADAGRWQHPLCGVLDLDQLEADYGRTSPALLVPIDDDVQVEPPGGQAIGDAIAASARELGAIDGRRTIAAELDQLAASDPLTAAWLERHGLGDQVAPSVPDVLRAVAADVTACRLHGRRERWDPSVPPGGYVCAEPDPDGEDGICGMPVEDTPCTIHHPDRST